MRENEVSRQWRKESNTPKGSKCNYSLEYLNLSIEDSDKLVS